MGFSLDKSDEVYTFTLNDKQKISVPAGWRAGLRQDFGMLYGVMGKGAGIDFTLKNANVEWEKGKYSDHARIFTDEQEVFPDRDEVLELWRNLK